MGVILMFVLLFDTTNPVHNHPNQFSLDEQTSIVFSFKFSNFIDIACQDRCMFNIRVILLK